MGALLQVLDIVLEVKRKNNSEKITRKKKLSNLQTCFFPNLDPSYFQTITSSSRYRFGSEKEK